MTKNDEGDDWLVDDAASDEGSARTPALHRPWKLLIVDDDDDVHSMTRLALRSVHYRNRPLQLVSAYSAAEGFEALQ